MRSPIHILCSISRTLRRCIGEVSFLAASEDFARFISYVEILLVTYVQFFKQIEILIRIRYSLLNGIFHKHTTYIAAMLFQLP